MTNRERNELGNFLKICNTIDPETYRKVLTTNQLFYLGPTMLQILESLSKLCLSWFFILDFQFFPGRP